MPRNHLKRLREAVFNEYLNLPDDIRCSTDSPLSRILSVGDRINSMLVHRRPAGRDYLKKKLVGEATSISNFLINDIGGTPKRQKPRTKKIVTRRKNNDS